MKVKEVKGNKVVLVDEAREQRDAKQQGRSAILETIRNERANGNRPPSIEDLDKKLDIIIEILTDIKEGR